MSDKYGFNILGVDIEDTRSYRVALGGQGGVSYSLSTWMNNPGICVSGLDGLALGSADKQDTMIFNLENINANTQPTNTKNRALFESGDIASTDYAILIDLSAEEYTSYLSIDDIDIQIKLNSSNSRANIKVGVVTRIDSTDADVSWLISCPFSTISTFNYISYSKNYISPLKMHVVGGETINSYSNEEDGLINAINTSKNLPSPRGSIKPGLGDCVVMFERLNSTFSSVISLNYYCN